MEFCDVISTIQDSNALIFARRDLRHAYILNVSMYISIDKYRMFKRHLYSSN